MKSRLTLVTIATLLALAPMTSAQDLVRGMELMKVSQAALGGEDAFAEIEGTFRKTTMKAKIQGMDLQFTSEVYALFPDRIHSLVVTPFGKMTTVINKDLGWTAGPMGQKDMKTEEIDEAHSDLNLNIFGVFHQLDNLQCTAQPQTSVEDEWCNVVQVSNENNAPRTYYLSAYDDTVFMIESPAKNPMSGAMSTRQTYIDTYRQVGKIRVPSSMRVAYDNEPFATITVDEFAINPPVDKSLFIR